MEVQEKWLAARERLLHFEKFNWVSFQRNRLHRFLCKQMRSNSGILSKLMRVLLLLPSENMLLLWCFECKMFKPIETKPNESQVNNIMLNHYYYYKLSPIFRLNVTENKQICWMQFSLIVIGPEEGGGSSRSFEMQRFSILCAVERLSINMYICNRNRNFRKLIDKIWLLLCQSNTVRSLWWGTFW